MDYTIKFLKEPERYIVTIKGRMTGDDFIKIAEALLNDPGYTAGSNGIFDHRNLIIDDVFCENLTKIRKFHVEHENKIGAGKCAMIVKSVSAWKELWSKGDKIKTENQVKVFESYEDGLKWL